MYYCAKLAHMILAVKDEAIGPEWDRVLSHKPVSFESSQQEILDYLRQGAVPECSVCPETYEVVEARQLAAADVNRIKQTILSRRMSRGAAT